MTILFSILGLIAGVLIVVLISANFAPNQFEVFAETVIEKPVSAVFDYVKYLKNQDTFNKWVMTDPNVKRTYTGTDGTIGAMVAWDSDNKQVGKGEQEITALAENQRVDWALRFEKPFKNEAGSYLETSAVSPGSTKVKWAFTGQLTYGMKVMHMVLSLRKMLTNDLAASLANLKAVLEK